MDPRRTAPHSRSVDPWRLGVRRRAELPLISEAEHLHHTTDDHADAFRQLCVRVGVGDFDRVFSDESW